MPAFEYPWPDPRIPIWCPPIGELRNGKAREWRLVTHRGKGDEIYSSDMRGLHFEPRLGLKLEDFDLLVGQHWSCSRGDVDSVLQV